MALVATKETCMTYPQCIAHSLAPACSLLLLAVTATAAVAETSAPADEPVCVVGSRADDIALCARHGVDDVVEIEIGYDGARTPISPASASYPVVRHFADDARALTLPQGRD
jgi:hypothetical protein